MLDASGKPIIGPDGRPRIRERSATHFATLPGGRIVPTGCRTDDAARIRAADLRRTTERVAAGVASHDELRAVETRARPLAESLDAYRAHLAAKGDTAAWAGCAARLTRWAGRR